MKLGAILVYDITDKNSFDRVQTWVKGTFRIFLRASDVFLTFLELHKIVGPDIVLAIVGNKVDLERSRTVSKEEAEKYHFLFFFALSHINELDMQLKLELFIIIVLLN